MTTPFDCTEYEDDLKAYADGELSWLRRRTVTRHLTHCASCQKEILEMTQIAEDLRSREPEDTLPSALREKLLEVPLAPNNGGIGKEASRTASPHSASPIIGGRGASSHKRRLPAWGFAALAIAAWFVCFPMIARHNLTAKHANRVVEPEKVASTPVSRTAVQPPAPSAAAAPTITVRLSDREAGTDDNNVYVHIKNPDSHYLDAAQVQNQRFTGSNTTNESANALSGDPDSLRQVHKEASIGVQVANPEATGDSINTMVQETGGYVAANNLTTGDDGLKTSEMIVKIPEAQFGTFLAQVAKLGSVQSKNITGQDITDKTSDANEAQSVQENDLAQSEARLKALGSKAKWEDQQNTRDLRIQLAQTRARLVLLKRMAALGTITIDLSQTPKAVPAAPVTSGFTGTLKATTHDALQSLVGSAGTLLALVIWLLAYAPIWVPLLFLGRYAVKEYRKREAT